VLAGRRLYPARKGSLSASESSGRSVGRDNHLGHRVKGFKLSGDARFLEKLTDLAVPEFPRSGPRAVRGREDPDPGAEAHPARTGLPLKRGRLGTMTMGTMTHDYKRNGTTCLFAALGVLQGSCKAKSSAGATPGTAIRSF